MIRLALPQFASDMFVRSAARWQETFKKDVTIILRQQAKSIITNSQRTGVMDFTPPVLGNGSPGSISEQKKAGELAILRDISKVYLPVGAAVAKARKDDSKAGRLLARLLRERKIEDALNIIRFSGGRRQINVKAHTRSRGTIVAPYKQTREVPRFKSLQRITSIKGDVDPAIHQRARKSNGRVVQDYPTTIVSDKSSLLSYSRKKMAMVGFHKSGWKPSAAAVGASVPSFVSRHSGPGRVINNLDKPGAKFGITFINETPGISRHNQSLYLAARAIQFAAGRIDRAVRGYLQRKQRL